MDTEDRASQEEWFRAVLLEWWQEHARTYPWRDTKNPFHVLIAEIMLRRTQARQVVPVFLGFTERFPDARSLAEADPQTVVHMLYPLGLHWRTPAFQLLARQLVQDWNGQVPSERDDLLSLPGVGEYVADAVRCFAFGHHAALIDTNTVRLAGRFLGFEHSGDVRRRRYVRTAIDGLMENADCRSVNLAMLDFAALICRAKKPQCTICPLARHCHWHLISHTAPI